MTNLVDVLVIEYQTLKTEQSDRIKTRDGMVYATMAVIGVTGWAAIQASLYDLLLAGAAAALILGWHYLSGDRKIAWARKHVRGTLRPLVADLLDVDPRLVFPWESPEREWGLRFYRTVGLVVDLVLFVGPAAGVVPWWLMNRWDHTWTSPMLWACPALAVGAAAVTVAAFGSTLNRKPIENAKKAEVQGG